MQHAVDVVPSLRDSVDSRLDPGLTPWANVCRPFGVRPWAAPWETWSFAFTDNEVLVARDACVPMTLVFVADVLHLAATIHD